MARDGAADGWVPPSKAVGCIIVFDKASQVLAELAYSIAGGKSVRFLTVSKIKVKSGQRTAGLTGAALGGG